MLILDIIFQLIGIVIILLVIYFLGRPIVHGAIYFPTTPRGTEIMLRLGSVGSGTKLVDLGSGDGRIVIEAAKRGATAVGYEINPVLVRRSRRAIERAGVAHRATVHWKSFWDADLSQFDIIIVYGIPYILRDLQKKFARELKPGTKILSNAFPFPRWKPTMQERKILLYEWPGCASVS